MYLVSVLVNFNSIACKGGTQQTADDFKYLRKYKNGRIGLNKRGNVTEGWVKKTQKKVVSRVDV